MGNTFSAVKTLIVPAIISLIIFLISTFVIVPLWRRYRNRYSQYLPLDTISNQTMSLRARMQSAITNFLISSTWRARMPDSVVVAGRGSFDSDDGEELGDVDEAATGRTNSNEIDSTRRLSRDLEQGFIDDSDEEAEVTGRGR
ncbi:hypothetical protein QBC42DRAFT_272925 [Cladorrhinum samala]|uniref:Uncharacterized protein n=1 Tax=Cladorrhinum samala TaxID=585594 RepID=A0AAV9HHS9_9PEZI|nr:hypothetical protein QBC42DRAFT_272925 [Cladorrhinum samala]